jgi:hypothetical protein
MKKTVATTCLFLFFQVYSSFINCVSACDKQNSNGAVCSAVAVVREHTATFIFPVVREKNWTWNRNTTKDNYLEFLWQISLTDSENPPVYQFGAYLFKSPGSAERNGTQKELLMAAQHSVFERSGNSDKERGDLEIQAVIKDSTVNIIIEDPETFDVLFRSNPSHACFQFSQLDKDTVLCRTKIEYRAGSDGNKWSVGKSPEEIVLRYCLMDAKGKRLSSDSWDNIRPLITWGDEPGWDTAIVLFNFRIVSTKIDGKKATVVVQYHNLGTTDTVDFKPLDKDEIIEFELVSDNGIWRINGPVNVPHVLPGAAIKHLQNLEAAEAARKSQLESVIKKIESSFESSFK